ncbi:WG repeat-containing protein [Leptospira bouyouniensis]|uniref:WG repeat-containing protein n=1 Tax=Leptospira bouyouniensis TaxID=2484911 RepID=A0A7I0IL02_9LEPT|nr:WG repeat-containing protein [Leptospira bouyouniensis]TGL04056.1 WG repeat-containing protein [Leptospira bouyouniensis]
MKSRLFLFVFLFFNLPTEGSPSNEKCPVEYNEKVVEIDDQSFIQVSSNLNSTLIQYEEAGLYSEGLALVKNGYTQQFIDQSGKVAIDLSDKFFFFQKPFSDGKAVFFNIENQRGAINKSGDVLFLKDYDQLMSFSEGIAPYMKDNKLGFIDEKGNELTKPIFEYDHKIKFEEGFSVIKSRGKYGFLDKRGKIIGDIIYEDANPFREGLASVKLNGKWGFINTKGKLVIQNKFENADSFSNGLCTVRIDGKVGYINTNGEIVIKPQYTGGRDFSGNVAFVSTGFDLGLINAKGETVFNPIFDIDIRSRFEGDVAPVRIKSKYGIIKNDGTFVRKAEFDNISEFSNGFAWFELNQLYGVIDKNGKIVIKAQFKKMPRMTAGFLIVEINGLYGYIKIPDCV